MCGPVILRIAPFIGLAAYVFDLYSDFRLGLEYFHNCHVRIALIILLFVAIPGWVKGFYDWQNDKKNWLRFAKFILGPIYFIPQAFYWHMRRLIDPTNEKVSQKSNQLKLAEVLYEALPQMVVNLTLMITLQIRTRSSYLSLAASMAVTILALKERQKKSLHKLYYILANLADIAFRCLALALCFAILWGAGVWFTVVYTIITIPILKCTIFPDQDFVTILKKAGAFYCVSGYYHNCDGDRKFRFISKLVFNLLAAGALVYTQFRIVNIEPYASPDECFNICKNGTDPNVKTSILQQAKPECGEFNLTKDGKQFFLYVLYGLIGLSCVEGILERFTNFPMPFNLLPISEPKKTLQTEMEDLMINKA